MKKNDVGTWKGKRTKKPGSSNRDGRNRRRKPLPGGRWSGDYHCGAMVGGQRCNEFRLKDALCWWHVREQRELDRLRRDIGSPGERPHYTAVPTRRERPTRSRRSKKPGRAYYLDGVVWIRCIDPRGGADRFAVTEPEWTPTISGPKWDWEVEVSSRTWYARDQNTGRYMHKVIFGDSPDALSIDHLNRRGWDNRRENLRLATPQEQTRNQARRRSPKAEELRCSNPNCRGAIAPPGMVTVTGAPACPACLTLARKREAGNNRYGKGDHNPSWSDEWEDAF